MSTHARDLEIFIAKLLRVGVILAGALMIVGWISQIDLSQLSINEKFASLSNYHQVSLMASLAHHFERHEWGVLICYAGMAVLISLPFLRVLMTMAVFAKNRDWILTGLSAAVVIGLLVSVSLGFEI